MSKQFDSKEKTNFIENPEELARELYGYDDETLLHELKEAELELERMKAEDPELEARIQAETDAGFEALMQRIHDENIKPVTEQEYSEKKKEEERKVTKLRPVLKVMFVAAAILVVLSGMGGVASARKEFEYQYVSKGKTKNETIWRNGDYSKTDGQLKQAYARIRDELGINVLALGYKPKHMIFEEVIIDKGRARLKFSYDNKIIYLKETKEIADQITDNMVSDRKEIDYIYNPLVMHEFVIEENVVQDGYIEYSTKFERDGAYYYFAGVIEREEFIEMVKYLNFLQE